jgi:FkbM family methyltransferase
MLLDQEKIDCLKEMQVIIHNPNVTRFLHVGKEDVIFESPVEVRPGTYDIQRIGAFTYMGGGYDTNMRGIESIGRFCSIASGVVCGQAEHPTDFISSSYIFHGKSAGNVWTAAKDFQEKNSRVLTQAIHRHYADVGVRKGKINIGNDVWIGEGVFISKGVSVGDGAIIAARSVVTKDVPAYAIVGGIPARVIRYRFDEVTIARLKKIRWWAYGLGALNNVNFEQMPEALDKIEENINNGAPVYAPLLVILSEKGGIIKNKPDVDVLTKNKKLDVTVYIGTSALCLDFNDAHERAQYYSERSDIPTLNTLIARQFVQQGDHVLDAGANIGYTSLHYLACGAALVHAIEPARSYFDRLERLASADLHVYNVAVGHVNRVLPLYLSALHRQGNTLNPAMLNYFPSAFKGAQTDTQMTQVLRCDDIFDHVRLNMMKIDIEGFEIECIKGALTCLAQPALRLVQVALYDRFFFEADQLLSPLFEYVYRAVIDPLSKQLKVMRLDDPQIKALQEKLPMYLYSKHPLSIH